MPAELLKDRPPSEVGESDTYNRIQMRRAVLTRGDSAAEAPEGGIARELLRVLIVDDYRATADITCRLIDAWGHDVRRTCDATSGLALAAGFRPDVILLDVVMPNTNGLELARLLRHQVELRHCFIIAHTGRTHAECSHQCDKDRYRPIPNQASVSFDSAGALALGSRLCVPIAATSGCHQLLPSFRLVAIRCWLRRTLRADAIESQISNSNLTELKEPNDDSPTLDRSRSNTGQT